MNQGKKDLLKLLYEGRISREKFLDTYLNGRRLNTNFFQDGLRKSISRQDADLLEEIYVLIDLSDINTEYLIPELNTLLIARWHFQHEDTISIIQKAENIDLDTVDHLFIVSDLELEYLSYDDTYQLARKCIKLISSIDSEYAIEKLNTLAKNENQVIANYAKKELNRES